MGDDDTVLTLQWVPCQVPLPRGEYRRSCAGWCALHQRHNLLVDKVQPDGEKKKQ